MKYRPNFSRIANIGQMTSVVAVALLLAAASVAWAAPPNPCYRAQMPNYDDPYSFYKCDAGGRAHLWRCAAGTMYDRKTEICDWEDQVRSRNGQTGVSGNRPTGGRGNESGAGRKPIRRPGPMDDDYDNGEDWGEYQRWKEQFKDEDNVNNGRGKDTGRGRESVGERDPQDNPCRTRPTDNAPRLYQNPDDCSTFFTCNMKRPVLTYCPRGYNFNPRRQGCDNSDPPGCRKIRGSQSPNDVFIYQRSKNAVA